MGAQVLTRPVDTEQVVTVADVYASQVMDLMHLVDGEDLHKALSGAFLLFLTDVSAGVAS